MLCPSCSADNATAAGDCVGCGAPLHAPVAIRQGTIVAKRYEILNPLGRGGMGEVYRARDQALDEVVALKILRADAAQKKDMVQRFKAEVKLARRVRHRNVCAIHNYGEDGGILFIAMELVTGEDLRQRLKARGAVPAEEAYGLSQQIAEGLEAIHDAGVIHRDLKTANIMLDGHGVVRLMDFGIAREWGAGAGVTATGKIIGTPEYMSPEQIRAQPLDYRTDVYSLGIVVYELFTGRLPFLEDSAVATIMAQLKQAPRLDLPTLSPALSAVLARALEKQADRRQESVVAFAEELRRARAGVAPPAAAAPPEASTQALASMPDAGPGAAAPAAPHAKPPQPEAAAQGREAWSLEFEAPASERPTAARDVPARPWNVDFEAPAAGEAPPEEIATLMQDLASSDAAVRWRAAQALGEHGTAAAPAAAALMTTLRDRVPFVRSAAAVALKRIRGG